MRSGSRCPAFYGEIPPMRWGILNDDGGYFYCITYNYERIFGTTSGEVKLRVPKLKGIQFETAIIERYKRRECSVENREIRRRTRAIGAFPDGNSALMLVCVRLRDVAASEWISKRYMDMEHLFKMKIEQPADEENPYI